VLKGGNFFETQCIFALWFLLYRLSFSSPNLSRHRVVVCNTCTHLVALVRIYDAGLKRAAHGSLTYRTQKIAQNSPSGHHRTTLSGISSQVRHLSTIEKNLLNASISSTCPRNMANFGPLAAEICWRVWGTPANFNRFRVLASLLQRRRSPEANKTLHDVWPYPGLVRYVCNFGGSCALTEFRHVQNSLCVQVLCSPILAALLHGTPAAGSAKLCGVLQGMELRNFRRGRHLYSAGRPSRWASAYILVCFWTPSLGN